MNSSTEIYENPKSRYLIKFTKMLVITSEENFDSINSELDNIFPNHRDFEMKILRKLSKDENIDTQPQPRSFTEAEEGLLGFEN